VADKKISDFTAATSAADGDLLEIETAGGNSRKITRANLLGPWTWIVRKTSDQTTANYSTAAKITWDSAVFDTGAMFNNGDDTFTVPAALNGKYCFFGGTVAYADTTAGSTGHLSVIKTPSGGARTSTYDGFGGSAYLTVIAGATTGQLQCVSGPVLLATGDKYDLQYQNSDTSTTVTAGKTNFWYQVI
jgi:hypothetical protein